RENKIDKKMRTKIERLKKKFQIIGRRRQNSARAFSERQISCSGRGANSPGLSRTFQALQETRGRCGGSQQRHGGRLARGELRRTAGNFLEYLWRERCRRSVPQMLRIALYRSRNQLSRREGF